MLIFNQQRIHRGFERCSALLQTIGFRHSGSPSPGHPMFISANIAVCFDFYM